MAVKELLLVVLRNILINDCCNQYDMFVGCSTGSLLLHLALAKTDKIKEIYTTDTQDNIFNISPFKLKKTADSYEFDKSKNPVNYLPLPNKNKR